MLSSNKGIQIAVSLLICALILGIWQLLPHPVIGVILCMAPLALLLILRLPFLMVLLFVLFSFFRIHEAFPQLYPLRIPLMLALAALTVLGWHIVFTGNIRPHWCHELSLFSAFFVLVSLGVVLAANREVAMAYFSGIYVKIAIMTFAIAWMTRSPGDFDLASKLIVIAGIAIALVALYNKANGIGLVEGTRVTIGRSFRSVLGDPNDLALVLLFPMAFAVALVMTPSLGALSRSIGIIGVPLLFAALIATQSRGGLLGILAVFAVYGYRHIRSKALLIGIGVVAMLALVTLAGISDRSSGGAAEEGIDESAMGRLYAWQAAFGMALDNPLTGVGIDNFYYNYFFYSPHWDGKNHAVHSTWFGVMAETGFLGLLIFIALITALLKSAIGSLNSLESANSKPSPSIHAASQAVLSGLIATLVSGTFLTQGFTWPIYILTALVVAIARAVEINRQLHAETAKPPTQNGE